MKTIFAAILLITGITAFAQTAKKREPPIQTVNRHFKEYISTDDNSPSKDTRDEMTKALTALQGSCNEKDLPLLINVWMYYDATDFPTWKLTAPIFIKHKTAALIAINQRLKNKRTWEDQDEAPYADLINLKKRLSK